MAGIGDFVQEHPALTIGGVIVVGLGLAMLLGGGGGQAAASGPSPDALLAYQASQNQIAAGASQQASAYNFELAAQAGDYAGQLALLKESDAAKLAAVSTAAQVTNNQTQAQQNVALAQLQNQASIVNSNQSVLLAAIKEHRDISLSSTGSAILTKGAGTGVPQDNTANIINSIGNLIGSLTGGGGGGGNILSLFA